MACRRSGVRVPSPPFDSLRSLMAGHSKCVMSVNCWTNLRLFKCESNALSERSESKGFSMSKDGVYYTYILKCSDGSYYVGSTGDLSRQLARHNAGRGPKWTACRLPVKLLYSETHESETEAVRRERQIKKWTRAKKEALITGDKESLKGYSKRTRKR